MGDNMGSPYMGKLKFLIPKFWGTQLVYPLPLTVGACLPISGAIHALGGVARRGRGCDIIARWQSKPFALYSCRKPEPGSPKERKKLML